MLFFLRLGKILESEINKVCDWMIANKLTPNHCLPPPIGSLCPPFWFTKNTFLEYHATTRQQTTMEKGIQWNSVNKSTSGQPVLDLIRGGFNKRRFLKCTKWFRSKQNGCNKRLDLLTVDLLTEFHCINVQTYYYRLTFSRIFAKLLATNCCT